MKVDIFKNLKAVFLDFDGVVVESTNIKTEAFYEIYLPYGTDIAESAKDYHLKNQGITRFVKFQEIHTRFLDKSCDATEQADLSRLFSKIVYEKIIKCPLVERVTEFLQGSVKKNIPVFLLSATPHGELLKIVKNRGLSMYFKEIWGAPQTKADAGKEILKRYSLNPEHVVFIGDSVSDYKAAQKLGTAFIGRQADPSLPVEFKTVRVIQDFGELI